MCRRICVSTYGSVLNGINCYPEFIPEIGKIDKITPIIRIDDVSSEEIYEPIETCPRNIHGNSFIAGEETEDLYLDHDQLYSELKEHLLLYRLNYEEAFDFNFILLLQDHNRLMT